MTTIRESMLKPGDHFIVREDAWPANQFRADTGEVIQAILDPDEGPLYRAWMDDYEMTVVYSWEIEAL